MYEIYFQDENEEQIVKNLKIKTLKLFKLKNSDSSRSVTSISWFPDGPSKIAASYSLTRFR